jgi:serine protease Do
MTRPKQNSSPATCRGFWPATVAAVCLLLACGARAQTSADPVDDTAMDAILRQKAEALMQAGKTVPAASLRAQLKRGSCDLSRLPAPSDRAVPPARTYQEQRDNILIIGGLYKCTKCDKWHASTAAAFALAAPDIFVSNYHVFKDTNTVAYVGMTRQQEVKPVAEILAANQADDIAIFRIPGLRVKPMALRYDAPVGTPVRLISHPEDHFYSFSQGTLARYSRQTHTDHFHLKMEITADFAKGSSGAPILDDCGNAIGMVAATRAVFYKKEDYESVQMVFKECIPASVIKKLFTPSSKRASQTATASD